MYGIGFLSFLVTKNSGVAPGRLEQEPAATFGFVDQTSIKLAEVEIDQAIDE